ncbi:MAG: HAMP domain-containing histidine kinase [Verrucomicrobia bacterium]|nr:HAMP domain-containing histidine kinase [Leptolyngbya sp. ES-bin-22]
MNQAILQEAQNRSGYQFDVAKKLQADSYQIDATEAELIASILADPLNVNDAFGEDNSTIHLDQKFEVERDFLLKEPATAFLFHVPRSYWKVVIVKPFSEAAMATYSIIQAEKMSGLGQLVSGVAHEVNNPINFIHGNLTYTDTYTQALLAIVKLYQQHYPDPPLEIQRLLEDSDLNFIATDLPKLLTSMQAGADRIRQLVLSLRNFARMDEAAVKKVDLHEGLESTLMLLESRLKLRSGKTSIQIGKNYGILPLVECYPGLLNQVFMNILINAIDALEESMVADPQLTVSGIQTHDGQQAVHSKQPTITIQTESLGQSVAIRIADNGLGVSQAVQQRLFDPFFTTKPVGKGIGLGLSISYQIVTEKHRGQLVCRSILGQGSEFCIEIPVQIGL